MTKKFIFYNELVGERIILPFSVGLTELFKYELHKEFSHTHIESDDPGPSPSFLMHPKGSSVLLTHLRCHS